MEEEKEANIKIEERRNNIKSIEKELLDNKNIEKSE